MYNISFLAVNVSNRENIALNYLIFLFREAFPLIISMLFMLMVFKDLRYVFDRNGSRKDRITQNSKKKIYLSVSKYHWNS